MFFGSVLEILLFGFCVLFEILPHRDFLENLWVAAENAARS